MSSDQGNTTRLQNLLDGAIADEGASYDQVINLAAERLQRLTGKMLRNYPHLHRWEETSDVFQTAVMRLHRSLTEVKPNSVPSFFGLAATQIRRTLIDLARKHFGPQGQAAKHHSDAGAMAGDVTIDTHPSASDQPDTLESWAEFHEAVEKLPLAEREVFELVWYGGMGQAEISALLQISVPTVKRRLRAARLSLVNALHTGILLDTKEKEHE